MGLQGSGCVRASSCNWGRTEGRFPNWTTIRNKTGVLTGETDWVRSPKLAAGPRGWWPSWEHALLSFPNHNKTGVPTGETDWVRSPKLAAANDSSCEHPPCWPLQDIAITNIVWYILQ